MVLAGQNLVGSISPYIGNLSFLTVIDLRNNSLHGSIPLEVHRLFRLQRLILNNNTIGGEIPVSIANCSQLRRIHLANNEIIWNDSHRNWFFKKSPMALPLGKQS